MAQLARAVTKMYTVLALAFGVCPPARSLLELLRLASPRVVVVARRRPVSYAALFDDERPTALRRPPAAVDGRRRPGRVRAGTPGRARPEWDGGDGKIPNRN